MNDNIVTKTRGRPVVAANQTEQRAKLVLAAKHLLNRKSYSQITIREIAAEANVNSAMIRYYFGSKEELFEELIEIIAEEQLLQFESLQLQSRPVYSFICQFDQFLQAYPGIVHLLSEEVLNKTTPLANAFMEAFPKRVSKFLPLLIEKETGITDREKTKLVAFGLMTKLVSPYIFKTLRQAAWQIKDAEIQGEHRAKVLYTQLIFGLKEQLTHEVEF